MATATDTVTMAPGDFMLVMVTRKGIDYYGYVVVETVDERGATLTYRDSKGATRTMTGVARSWGLKADICDAPSFLSSVMERGGQPFMSLVEAVDWARFFLRNPARSVITK